MKEKRKTTEKPKSWKKDHIQPHVFFSSPLCRVNDLFVHPIVWALSAFGSDEIHIIVYFGPYTFPTNSKNYT